MNVSYSTQDPAEVMMIFLVSLIFLLVVLAVCIVPTWKIYQKAGYKGWECIVPYYNNYTYAKMCFGNGWLFLLMLVPCVNIGFIFVEQWKFCKSFGKGIGFYIMSLFFPIIALYILAFGSAVYVGYNSQSYGNSGYMNNTQQYNTNTQQGCYDSQMINNQPMQGNQNVYGQPNQSGYSQQSNQQYFDDDRYRR